MKTRKFTAIYYRISKKFKNDIRMQKKICRDFCLSKNINNFKEYEDIGINGSTKEKPALNKIIEDAKLGKINQIIVYKIDRLGRNFSQVNNLNENLQSLGININSATQKFNFKTREGKLILRILMMMAEFESGMISDRVIDGIKSKKYNPQK